MNRNTQQHFATTPTVNIGRSKFDRSYTHKTTFSAGSLIPFFVDTGIMPGDTVKMNTAQVVRMMTPIAPVMDNANLDTYFFFVPYRLIWDHFREFMGENRSEPWYQKIEYEIPQVSAPTGGWTKGSLADYMGIPTNVDGFKCSVLPFRAYSMIYNEWFRDQNLENPVYISMGDSDTTGIDTLDANYDPVTDTECGARPLNACKYHDYFTSCLPGAQKGPAVTIPLGNDSAPVLYKSMRSGTYDADGYQVNLLNEGTGQSQTIKWRYDEDGDAQTVGPVGGGSYNFVTDLSDAVGATVNQLRQAFQIQKFYEKQALYGSRYIELVKGHFGVTNPDFRVQRPEYLGGFRTPININQVVQTDATSQNLSGHYDENNNWVWDVNDLTPQGNTAAYSLTSGRNKDLFTHSFTEHGILMGLCCVRTVHTYQQGLNRQFLRKKWSDFYWPEFANLGNTAVTNNEIYLQSDTVVDADGKIVNNQAFGYQEAWADYRYFPDTVTGEMRSNYTASLDIWHWADDYNTLPSLGDEWIQETGDNIQRTLAVQNHDQFFGDFYFNAIYTRPMPLYSVPGLIDHH